MNIVLTEKQIKNLIKNSILEGITYNKSGDWGFDVDINSDSTDKGNKGFDTRLFGTANDILNKGKVNFGDKQKMDTNYINMLIALKNWVNNGRNGLPPISNEINKKSEIAVKKALELDDEDLLQWIDNTLLRIQTTQQMYQAKYNKATNANGEEKMARYNVGVVPGTNLKVISLFDFDDFNISDVLKNGYMRQNDDTDKKFGIDKNSRPMNPSFRGKNTLRTIPVTYNGITPDIEKNFSLNGIGDDKDHFNRVQYGVGDEQYHSVARFIDKSINYAQYALKKEHVEADYIVCAPSSSKFNIYYAKRLQDKTGIQFINGFFEKKVINVHFDRKGMQNEGIPEEQINNFELTVKKAGMKEISNSIALPIRQFIDAHWDIFKTISFDIFKPKFRGRKPAVMRPEEKRYSLLNGSTIQKNQLYQIIATKAYEELGKMIYQPGSMYDDNASKLILNELKKDFSSPTFDTEKLSQKIGIAIQKYCMQDFTAAIRKMAWLVATYHKKLMEGFQPNFEGSAFKVTRFSKNVRKYLKGAFIIADAQLNKDKNLFTRYIGKKYIIFDEDMNSGATLAMLGDTMEDYGIKEQDITCLVNGYSSGGF